MAPSRKKHSFLKNYLVPHKGNGFHPKLFKRTAVGTLALLIVIFEGAYLLDTRVAQDHTSFLASVLPAALFSLANGDRADNNIAPLVRDPKLDAAAQLKADDMAQKGYFAHTSPEGKTPWYWLDQVGYSYTYAGENLAVNFDDSSAVEDAWMNSPTHRANIVKPQYTRVGYAVARGQYEGKETTFVVQEFAAKPNDETVTNEVAPKGVVAKAVEKVVQTVTAPVTKNDPAPPAAVTSPAVTRAPSAEQDFDAGTNTDTNAINALSANADAAQNAPLEISSRTPAVLSAQANETITTESGFGTFLKRIAASPHRASLYVLGTLGTVMLLLLGYVVFAHRRLQYAEVLVGGLAIVIFAFGVLAYNATHALTPVVPQGAAAIQALTP